MPTLLGTKYLCQVANQDRIIIASALKPSFVSCMPDLTYYTYYLNNSDTTQSSLQ